MRPAAPRRVRARKSLSGASSSETSTPRPCSMIWSRSRIRNVSSSSSSCSCKGRLCQPVSPRRLLTPSTPALRLVEGLLVVKLGVGAEKVERLERRLG